MKIFIFRHRSKHTAVNRNRLECSLSSMRSKLIVEISGKVVHELPQENSHTPHHNKLKKVDPALFIIF